MTTTKAPEKGEERQEAAEIRLRRADDETDSSSSIATVVECCAVDVDQDAPNAVHTYFPKCSEVATLHSHLS